MLLLVLLTTHEPKIEAKVKKSSYKEYNNKKEISSWQLEWCWDMGKLK
jgi:hypothetical protein